MAGSRTSPADAGIYTVKPDGTGLEHIANTVAGDVTPSISRDGETIVFSDKDAQITSIKADGTNRTKLTQPPVGHDDPILSPDGNHIAYLQDHGDAEVHPHDLFVMNADGTGARQIATLADPREDLARASWSPDGNSLVFTDIVAPEKHRDLYTVKEDGSGRARLGQPDRTVSDYQPAWSPDGKHIAFTEESGPDKAIWTMNEDGSGRTRVSAAAPTGDGWSSWSADSTKLVFDHAASPASVVMIMDDDGANLKAVTIAGTFSTPGWAPGA